jgi:hypothetical protein
MNNDPHPERTLGISACRRIGVFARRRAVARWRLAGGWARGRNVSAYRRVGVSACRRIGVFVSDAPWRGGGLWADGRSDSYGSLPCLTLSKNKSLTRRFAETPTRRYADTSLPDADT